MVCTPARGIALDALDDPNIDIISTHHYPDSNSMVEAIADARRVVGSRKAYLVGEYGFVPTSTIQQLLDQVISNGAAGALIWVCGSTAARASPACRAAGGSLYKASLAWLLDGDAPTADRPDVASSEGIAEIRGEAAPEHHSARPAAARAAIRWQARSGLWL
jgi:hypothetical protein